MAQKILAVLIWEEAVKKWPLSGWPACLQSGHDLAGRFGRVIPLYGTLGPAGLRELLTAVRRSLASSAARISSSKEVRTWDISGFIEVRVRDLNSVLYLGFTSLGKSGWISLSQVRAMKFSYVGVKTKLYLLNLPNRTSPPFSFIWGTACLISCELSLFVYTAASREGILLATYASLASLARGNWRWIRE